MEEEYERSMLAGSAVPSVVLITPSATLTQDVADEAKASWVQKFGGPVREPAIVAKDTQVVPLSWSPSDAQLVEARRMSLLDVSNMFNLDGYWVGAPTAGITYKTAAPQYQQILRTSIEPVLADFEDVWSYAWLPRGQRIRFDRQQLLREDLATATLALVQLVAARIITPADAAMYLGLPTAVGEPLAAQEFEETPAGPEPAPADTGGPP
jgi:phage portal protein BeeE